MSLVTAAMVPPLRRSSRIRQQMKSSSEAITPSIAITTSIAIIPSIDITPSTASLSNERRSRRLPRRNTSSSKGTASTPMTPFPLLKLPREIRDMVYAVLVSAGDLSILRTCHEVNSEVQSRFYREAICRKEAGYCVIDDSYYDYRTYNSSSSLQAQNFELRCDLDSSLDWFKELTIRTPRTIQTSHKIDPVTFRHASSFGRGDIRRKQMIIELKFGAKTSLSEAEYMIARLFDKPEVFVGFQLLVVKLLSVPKNWNVADKTRIGLVVRNILEPALGAAVHYEGNKDDDECIEFHPWSLVGSQSHRLEPVWFIKKAVWDSDGQDSLEEWDDD